MALIYMYINCGFSFMSIATKLWRLVKWTLRDWLEPGDSEGGMDAHFSGKTKVSLTDDLGDMKWTHKPRS